MTGEVDGTSRLLADAREGCMHRFAAVLRRDVGDARGGT